MKLLKLNLLFFFFLFTTLFAENKIKLNSNLKSVTVFTKGAELFRFAQISLNKGRNEIILKNLEAGIDENSIRLLCDKSLRILSVEQRNDFLGEKEKPEDVKKVEEEIKKTKDKINVILTDKEIYLYEIDMILSNKKISDKTKKVNISDFKILSNYYHSHLKKIKLKIYDLDKQLSKANEELKNLEKQLNELTAKINSYNEIIISFYAEKNLKTTLAFSYFIYNAGWFPSYDIRSNNIKSKIEIDYKANIWQRTGKNWKDIDLKLSTANPTLNGNKPDLRPLYVDFMRSMQKSVPTMGLRKQNMEEKSVRLDAEIPEENFSVFENQLAVEFIPQIDIDIPSDGKPHITSVQKKEFEAEYKYYAAPKLSQAAYLMGYIKNFVDASFLHGKANLFFDGSYVGSTYINPNEGGQMLSVSFGQDKNIIIKRKEVKDYTETKFLSNNIERIFSYEISIYSKKSTDINIEIEENIPISKHENIEVNLINTSGGDYNNSTGIITWKLNLQAGKEVKKTFSYSMKYPQDKNITYY